MIPGSVDAPLRRTGGTRFLAYLTALLCLWATHVVAETNSPITEDSATLAPPRYIPLQKHGAYDVEALIFDRGTTQAAVRMDGNTGRINMDGVVQLAPKPDDWPEWKKPDQDIHETQKIIEGQTASTRPDKVVPLVLVDFVLDDLFLIKTAEKLAAQPGWRVLLHKKWRLQPSDFNQPVFLDLSATTRPQTMPITDSSDEMEKSHSTVAELIGKMAFSKGRYLHIEAHLQIILPGFSEELQAVTLKEKRQVRSGFLHYFDHPDFGLLVRITPVEKKNLSLLLPATDIFERPPGGQP